MVIEVSERLNWSSISENELVLLVQKNQGEAFVELASRYFPLIHRIAYPYRSALLEAEDLSQEGLLGLYHAARTFRQTGGASFSTYAGVCISNCIVSAFRRANDLAMAMEARCYHGGEGRTKMKPLRYKRRDVAAYILTLIYFAAIFVIGRYVPFKLWIF